MSKLSKKEPQAPQWIVVYVTNDITVAHIVAGRLKHEGIHAIIDHMAGRDAIGITIGVMGEVRVLVHPQDYDDALDILEPEDPPELADDNDQIIFDEDDFDK